MRASENPASGALLVVAGELTVGEARMEHAGSRPPDEPTVSAAPEESEAGLGPMGPTGGVARGWAYVVAAGVPLAFAVFMLRESLGLGLGSMHAPGPGLWPFALSVALVVLTLVLLAGWDRFGPCEAWGEGAVWMMVGAASVAPFILLVPQVGFEIPAVALLVFWFKVLGHEKWLLSLAVAGGTVVVLHVLFIEVLGTSIPYLFGI